MQGCCSQECTSIINLSDDEQKAIRRGLKNGNKIFKKGKSDVLTFRNSANNSSVTINFIPKQKVPKIKKIYLGNATHYFVKAGVGQFEIENSDVKIGEKILITGSTVIMFASIILYTYSGNAVGILVAYARLSSISSRFVLRAGSKLDI